MQGRRDPPERERRDLFPAATASGGEQRESPEKRENGAKLERQRERVERQGSESRRRKGEDVKRRGSRAILHDSATILKVNPPESTISPPGATGADEIP